MRKTGALKPCIVLLTGCPCTVEVAMKPVEEPPAPATDTPNGDVTSGAIGDDASGGVKDAESGEVT